MSGLRVAVLSGGRSLERQVSLVSGARVADALERLGHDATAIDAGHTLVTDLRELAPDVVFVALHGGDGEDGTVQELLEALGLRYTGSRPAACVRSWDKVLAKELLREAGVPTPDDLVFSESAVKELGAADALDASRSGSASRSSSSRRARAAPSASASRPRRPRCRVR